MRASEIIGVVVFTSPFWVLALMIGATFIW